MSFSDGCIEITLVPVGTKTYLNTFKINALYGWSIPAKMALLREVKYFREMLIQNNQLANEMQYNVYILPKQNCLKLCLLSQNVSLSNGLAMWF